MVKVIVVIHSDGPIIPEPMIMNEYAGDGEVMPASEMVFRPNPNPALPGSWVSIRDLLEEYNGSVRDAG